METLHLTFVGRYTTNKDNQPLIGKNGKPYTSLRIKCNEHGDKYLSGFDGPATASWKIGDTVEVEVLQNGTYLNFTVPKKNGSSEADKLRLTELENKITRLTLRYNKLVDHLMDRGVVPKPIQKVNGTELDYPESNGPTAFEEVVEEEIRPEDIPF